MRLGIICNSIRALTNLARPFYFTKQRTSLTGHNECSSTVLEALPHAFKGAALFSLASPVIIRTIFASLAHSTIFCAEWPNETAILVVISTSFLIALIFDCIAQGTGSNLVERKHFSTSGRFHLLSSDTNGPKVSSGTYACNYRIEDLYQSNY